MMKAQQATPAEYTAKETENKARLDVSQTGKGWKFSYGASLQYVDYVNNSFVRRRAEVRDNNGNVVQPADIFLTTPALIFGVTDYTRKSANVLSTTG